MGPYTIRLKGFQPDRGKLNEGAFQALNGVCPTENGYSLFEGISQITSAGTFVSTAVSAKSLQQMDGQWRIFVASNSAGSNGAIYKGSNATWTNVSRVSGYSGITRTAVFSFTQKEDVSIAAQISTTLQALGTSVGNFADITGGPQAAFVETVGQFVIVAKTATSVNQWICSALGDHTDWTTSVTTQCATGEITSAAGPITGLKRLGDNIVIYKKHAIFLGRYVGASNNTWAFEQIPGVAGCIAPNSIVSIGYAHFFLGSDNFYLFDGVRALPIGDVVNKFFFNSVSGTKAELTYAQHDPVKKLVYWYYQSSSSFDRVLVFNYENKNLDEAWGIDNLPWKLPLTFLKTTDSDFEPYPAALATNGTLYKLNGGSTAQTSVGSWVFSTIGHPAQFRTLKNVYPNWLKPPLSITGTVVVNNDLTGATGTTVVNNTTLVGSTQLFGTDSYRLECLASGRYFKISFSVKALSGTQTVAGDYYGAELDSIALEFEDDGTE